MAPQDSRRDESDESFLDRVFERAVAALEEGHSLSVSELLGGREDLRRDIERLVVDARSVACVRPDELPRVHGYTVIEELGRGGMGAVYLARQDALGGRRVALKLLPAAASASARSRTRFLNEARTLASVRHPNVVTVHDVIESDSVCAYAMEWVDGASLSQLIQRARNTTESARQPELSAVTESLALEQARAAESYALFICRVGLAIARALSALHRAGFVHRDVKPSNVLLRRDGTALLSDFGLVQSSEAGLTKTGEFVGTVLYASPEQLEGESERLDARSDIYSLGVTLYQALTLRLPFDDASAEGKRVTTPTGMLRLIESRSAVPLRARDRTLPRDLETILATALEIDPVRRYASADELADDLERLLSLRPIHARPASALSRAVKFVRRNRSAARGLIVGSAASIALALVGVVYFVFAPRWADEHVRDARLALLDPGYANGVFVTERFAAPESARGTILTHDGLRRALESYDAALRWKWSEPSLRAERDVVARALDGKVPEVSSAEPRLAGLAAYLAADVDRALEHWSDAERLRDPRASPDPLVEAMLGVLLLVRDEPARAYPRLREACRMFPDVGFLATYHADAAVRCGDYETAERLLGAAREMPRLDSTDSLERVTADLYASIGREVEAEQLYRKAAATPLAALHHARLLDRRGRYEEALERYLVAFRLLRSSAQRAEYAAVLVRWWTSLSDSERSHAIAETLELSPTDPRSLVARLRELRTAPVEREKPANSGFFATLRRWRSSPPLQSLGLPELARILEVEDMHRWSAIPSQPKALKHLHLLAWRSPWPKNASRAVDRLTQRLFTHAPRTRMLLAALASTGSVAAGQNCPTAPCFQGLGDLPGGANYSHATCISGDGTHVGGASTTSLSSGPQSYEPFVWDALNGLVHLGDLSGGTSSGETLALSSDGSVGVGWSASGNCTYQPWIDPTLGEGFRWTAAGGLVALGDIGGGAFFSQAWGVSDDGVEVAGLTNGISSLSGEATLFSSRWTSTGGWSIHGTTSCYQSFYFAQSRNGEWAAGRHITSFGGVQHAIRESTATGYQPIITVPHLGSSGYLPNAVSDDGTVVGINYTTTPRRAWMWSDADGLIDLPDVSGGIDSSAANAVTRDGALVTGFGHTAIGQEAVLWDSSCAVYRLHDVLVAAGVSIPNGWLLRDCKGIVVNGGEISVCGTGVNPSGDTEAFVARFVLPWMGASNYCTAGTTTNGCNATMSASGTPSVAATSGFTLSCANVEGQKSGLVFYGVNGPHAALWAPGSSSYLCVKSPVQRTASANSGGAAGACDGSFSLDFLGYLATHPGALGQPFTAGACVNAQTWFRDPPAPGTTNLSNGLQFITTP